MSETERSFVDRCLNGEALLDDIDDEVQTWHRGNAKASLSEFLGFSDAEYAIWVRDPDSLKAILYSRRFQVPLADALEHASYPAIAARAASQAELQKILRWLRNKKLDR